MVPIARQSSKSKLPGESFLCPSDKTDPRFIAGYDAGLKDGVRELQARIDDLERQLENIRGDIDGWREIANAWRDRADEAHRLRQQDHAQAALRPLPYHQITEEMRQSMMLQAQAAQQAYAQQAYAQQNQALAQQQQNYLPDFCNCVPGRGGFLRGSN